MRWIRSCRVTVLCLSLIAVVPTPGPAQTLTRDAVSGNFTLVYTDYNGIRHSVIIESADRIDPVIEVDSIGSETRRLFRYRVRNRLSSVAKTPIMFVALPCPASLPDLSVATPGGRQGRLRRAGRTFVLENGATVCLFGFAGETMADMLNPGSVSGPFDIVASALPAIIQARAIGFAAMVEFPGGHWVTPDTVYALAEKAQAQGLDLARGGGQQTLTVGPGREYSAASTLASGAGILRRDVNAVCGSAGWITVDRACVDLKGFLTDESVDLPGFLSYMDSQRGEGKPLSNSNAYFLLKTIAEYARSRVTSANVELGYVCGTRLIARNRNSVGMPVTYEVMGVGETGSLRLPPRAAGQAYSETTFTTKVGGQIRINYGGIPVVEQTYESRSCP